MSTFDEVERAREMNEGVHPVPPVLYDQEGDFAVIVDRPLMGEDGDTYTHSQMPSLIEALRVADSVRRHMASSAEHLIDVYVIDKKNESRGPLDWSAVS